MRRASAVWKTGLLALSYPQTHLSKVGIYRVQQTRYVSSVPEVASTCWNCQKLDKQMICADCGSLQDVNANINYFELLNFPSKFTLPPQELTQRFRQLQARVHPDKYSNKSTREQTNSADWSSLINKAYKTLSTPIERGQYMLQLEGEQMPQDNSALNKTFLMNMMERNEEVEEAEDSATLDQLYAQLTKELDDKTQELATQFEAKNLIGVKETLVEMKYLLSIQSSIKKKQQQMFSST